MFEDGQLEADRARRDPLAAAKPAAAVRRNKAGKSTPEGLPLHSFDTLLDALSTRCENACRVAAAASTTSFRQRTAPTPLQKRAFELLGL